MVKQGQDVAAVGLRCPQGSTPGTGCSHGAYAGETWLVDTDEVSVLPADVSSSPRGFFPQQRVVIMQLRNWERGKPGEPAGHHAALAAELSLNPADTAVQEELCLCGVSCPTVCFPSHLLPALPAPVLAPPSPQHLRFFRWNGLAFVRFVQHQG